MAAKAKSSGTPATVVGILMGSDSDFAAMKPASDALLEFGIASEMRVISAHRTPQDLVDYMGMAATRGLRIVIAGAGGAAHLPGMCAALTALPVIGVPIEHGALRGVDALYSIVQMPSGVPVAAVGIGAARNAGLLAVRILAVSDEKLRARYETWMQAQAEASRRRNERLAC